MSRWVDENHVLDGARARERTTAVEDRSEIVARWNRKDTTRRECKKKLGNTVDAGGSKKNKKKGKQDGNQETGYVQ